MAKFLFYGDSFTYGEDAGHERGTWPAHFLDLIGEQFSNHRNYAMSGQSNTGIFMDILDAINRGELNSDSIVFVGFTNVWRDATTIGKNPGCYRFNEHHYRSVNMHYRKDNTPLLNNYAEIIAEENEWLLYVRNFNIVLATKNLLDTIGCEYYLIDMILNQIQMKKLVQFNDSILHPLIAGNNCRDLFGYFKNERDDVPMSPNNHFYSEGYREIAKTILEQTRWAR